MRSNEPLIREIEGLNARIDNLHHRNEMAAHYAGKLEVLVMKMHENKDLTREQRKLFADIRLKYEV